jgi:hypothetical protein
MIFMLFNKICNLTIKLKEISNILFSKYDKKPASEWI